MKHLTLTGRSLPVNLIASGVMSLLLLTSCGSKEYTRIKCGSFEYEDTDIILPRTFVVHTRVFGIQADYNEQMKLPTVRAGLIDVLWITDVKSTVMNINTFFGIPWLFTSSNTYSIIPTTNTTDYSELLKREQRILFDPDKEARLPCVEGVTATSLSEALPAIDTNGHEYTAGDPVILENDATNGYKWSTEEAELLFNPSAEAVE